MAVLRVSWCRIPLGIFVLYIDILWFDLTSVVLESSRGVVSAVAWPLPKVYLMDMALVEDLAGRGRGGWVASNGK